MFQVSSLGSRCNVFPIYLGIFLCQCSSFSLRSKNVHIGLFGDTKVPPGVNEWCVCLCVVDHLTLTRNIQGCIPAAQLLTAGMWSRMPCYPDQEQAGWILCKWSVKDEREKSSLEGRDEARGKLVGVLAVIISIYSRLHLMHSSLQCGPSVVSPVVSLTLPQES